MPTQVMTIHPKGFMQSEQFTEFTREKYGVRSTRLNERLDDVIGRAELRFKEIDRVTRPSAIADEMRKAAREYVAEVKSLRKAERELLDRDRQQAKRNVPDEIPVQIDNVQIFYAKRTWLLDTFRQVPQSQRAEVLLAEASNGESDLLLTLQVAPTFVRRSLISEKDFTRAMNRYWEAKDPVAFKALRAAEEYERSIEYNVAITFKRIAKGQDTPTADEAAAERERLLMRVGLVAESEQHVSTLQELLAKQ